VVAVSQVSVSSSSHAQSSSVSRCTPAGDVSCLRSCEILMCLCDCSDLYYVLPHACSLWHVDDLSLAGKDVRPQAMNELTTVAWILKKYDVLCIQTDRPHVFVLIKDVLHHEDHRDVSVTRSSCEYLSQPLVCLVHYVIEDD